jgi:hypothetical protein
MFVRFRTTPRRLQVSLITTRRSAGKVRHEHIASLGSAPIGPSLGERIAFWTRVYERLARPTNRLDPEALDAILAAVHARIPMPTQDEQHAEQLERAHADARFWETLHGLHNDRIEGGRALQEHGKRMVADSETEAEKVAETLAASRARLARAQAGKAVAVPRQMTAEEMFKALGWTKADWRHAERLSEIDRLRGWKTLMDDIMRRHHQCEKAAARVLLRRLQVSRAGTDEPRRDGD